MTTAPFSLDDPDWQYPPKRRNINVLTSQPWQAWTEIDMCKICGKGPFSITFEVNWEIRDTKELKYCSEMCRTCLYDLSLQDPDFYDPEYLIKFRRPLLQRGIYPEYAGKLLDDYNAKKKQQEADKKSEDTKTSEDQKPRETVSEDRQQQDKKRKVTEEDKSDEREEISKKPKVDVDADEKS